MRDPVTPANHDDPEEAASLGFERLVFFSDAVCAIAITLLVIDLRLLVPISIWLH